MLAAITGVFVIAQVREEIELEKAKPHPELGANAAGLSPMQQKARQLEDGKLAAQESDVRQARLTLVSAIALWLFVGELIHGFGDVLFDYASGRPEGGATVHREEPLVPINRTPSKRTTKLASPLSGEHIVTTKAPN